jgi:hypothetical protein
MIDLLLQVGYVLLVLAVLSFFFCTLPVWLIVVVVVLGMIGLLRGRQISLVIKKVKKAG